MTQSTASTSKAQASTPHSTSATRKSKPKDWIDSKSFSFRGARIEHILKPGGVLRRYVVLESSRLRAVLGQPRRREIEALHAKQEQFELKTSELWALAEVQADRSLRLLHEQVQKLEQLRLAEAPAHIASPRLPGKVLEPSVHEGHALGLLVRILPNAVDVLEDNGEVRRIEGVDLARALDASGAQERDRIRVIPSDRHTVTIHEERTGSHGEGRRKLQRSRKTYEIVREAGPPHSSADDPRVAFRRNERHPTHISEEVYRER